MSENKWEKQIAYLGPEASFTYLAAKGLFPNDWHIPFKSIPECIEAVTNGKVELAVVPVENALEGSVPLTIDYLYHEAELFVTAEVMSKIQQHLLVNKKFMNDLDKLDEIYSHTHALAQCHKYLYYNHSHVKQTSFSSTAAAAELVSQTEDRCIAAIANASAAEKYNLHIAEHNIHDFHFNHTRFFVLSKQNIQHGLVPLQAQPKTTFMLTLPTDVSGALHQVLSVFAWRKLNLSKIESRPLKTGIGNYFFIADILADENEPMMKGAVEELIALGCTVKSLGTYFTYATPD